MMRAIFLTMISLVTLPAFGGGYSVGNGGVIWSCQSGDDRQFFGGMLTDLHEARERHGWTTIADPGGDPMALYRARKDWLARELPDMHAALQTRFERVESIFRPVRAILESTDDFYNPLRPLPDQCPRGSWKARNIANFHEEDGKLYIDHALWESPLLPTLDKAALLFHEAIYLWTRTVYAQTNSNKARQLTGVLFSTLAPSEMIKEIARILGSYPDQPEARVLCVMRNGQRNQLYVAYAKNRDDAEFTAEERCRADADPHRCSLASVQCEAVDGAERRSCIARNNSTGKAYRAQGRSMLEAQFNAHMSCFIASKTDGARKEMHCPDFEFMQCK